AAETLGRRLVDGVTPVHIFDESYEVRLQVHRIESYSAHADRDELVAWVGRMPRVGQICLVHGEEQQCMALSRHLIRRGIKTIVPQRGQRVTV
ncbi:MAG: MBL fold metallo-hydrolase, partial [Bacillati bacterium ANGP1]